MKIPGCQLEGRWVDHTKIYVEKVRYYVEKMGGSVSRLYENSKNGIKYGKHIR